jgi:ParB family transcriptional regulator, chromosome partitioning protein
MGIEEISARACRMWQMHERLGEYIDTKTCASLIDSVQLYGQKQPALGRRIRKTDGFEIELIYGARRLFVAQHLRRKLLVDVREIDDRTALIEMDIENRVRTDISPYERGLSYRRWLNGGLFKSQSEVAKALGVSEAQISRLLKYAAIPAAIIEAFESPSDIKEEWAVVLAKKSQDPEFRKTLLWRSRNIARSCRLHTPQSLYATLIRESAQAIASSKTRDEVVRDSAGRPLLRIGFRAQTVHLILPREKVTPDLLEKISEQVKEAFEAPSHCYPGRERQLTAERHTEIVPQGVVYES